MRHDAMNDASDETSVDFLDLADGTLYFDEAPVPGVDALIAEAAALYGEPEAEARLLRAYFLAPEQLSVIVALYRYYFYQHRLDDTLIVAERAIALGAWACPPTSRRSASTHWRGSNRRNVRCCASTYSPPRAR